MQGTTKHTSSDATLTADARAAKARLFGDESSDRLHKQLLKARFLRNLQQPTGGLDTRESSEDATLPSTIELPEAPVRIGRYAILRKLGQGGMGVVYVAYDEDLDRKIAVKLLRGELCRDERGRARMLREAQALARLSHPNVVQVHEVGQWSDHDYVAMEFVDGQTLDRWLAARKRSWREILDTLCEAGRGLEAAHAAGLVHRDFKPANLMIARDGRARVLDFGLARAIGERDTPARGAPIINLVETAEQSVADVAGDDTIAASSSAFDKLLTATGALLGTPAYMAPEQHLGRAATVLSDQFSFCVVLYEALFGQRPFRGKSRDEYAVRVTEGQFEPPPSSAGVPAWLRKAVVRGLAPRPEDRWPSMSALLAELCRDRTRSWKGVAIATGLIAAVLTAAVVGDDDQAQLCAADPGSVADSWGETQRDAVAAAFAGTGMAEADAVLDHARRSLDGYAEQLVAARAEACEARWIERSQTDAQLQLRGACLDQRERELAAVVEVLADADREVVLHTPELLAGLGDVGLCARVDLLEAGTPAPKDAAAVARIAELRGLIAKARAARDVGRHEQARALTARATTMAEQVGFEPALGEVYNLESRLLRLERDFVKSRQYATRAAALAYRHDAHELAADAWLNLAFIATESGVDPDSNSDFLLADAAIMRIGTPDRHAALLSLARGLTLRSAGRHRDALAEFDRALDSTRSEFAGSALVVSDVLMARSDSLLALGRAAEARADIERVASVRGTLTRGQIDAIFDLAVSEIDAGEFDGAEQHLHEAMRAYEQMFGPNYDSIGHGHLALAKIAMRRGDPRAAKEQVELALVNLGESHEHHGWALDALASIQLAGSEPLAAIDTIQRAIEHQQRQNPGDVSRLAYLSIRLGEALDRADRSDAALVEFERALGYLDGQAAQAPLELARALLGVGRVRLAQDQPELALESLERAVALAPVDAEDVLLAVRVRVEFAETLMSLQIRRDDRRAFARTAVKLLERLPAEVNLLERAHELSEAPDVAK